MCHFPSFAVPPLSGSWRSWSERQALPELIQSQKAGALPFFALIYLAEMLSWRLSIFFCFSALDHLPLFQWIPKMKIA